MTDIVDRIRQVATALGWKFTYGEVDIKNLIEAAQAQDLVPDEVHLMLLPVVRTPQTNEYGGISSINYELAFSIFTPDDFDILVEDNGKEYYWHKFDYKVKPMLTAYYYLHRNLICPGIALQPRRITEIYNDGTENLTGIFIEASASIEVDSLLGEVVPVPPLPPVPALCDILADCEVFRTLEQRVTDLEAVTPDDLISSDTGNALQAGTDGGLYVPESGGAGIEWGQITGTLSDQTDLQAALNAKQDALAFTPENVANKSTNVVTDQASNTKYPTVKSLFDWATSAFTTTAAVASQITAALTGYATQAWVTAQGYITLAQARAGSYTRFFADFGNTSVNTNTTNNVIGSVLIPANTITGNAILEIESAISRATSGANPLHRMLINTVNSYTGANQIAGISTSTTALWSKGERSFKASTGVIRGYNSGNYQGIDDLSNANAPTSTSVDWTVDQYILTVVNNATGETTTHEYTTVKVLTV